MVPMVEFPPATPFTSHVTAVLVLVVVLLLARFTVAVKSACVPGATVADEGVIETDVTVVALEPPQPDTEMKISKTIRS